MQPAYCWKSIILQSHVLGKMLETRLTGGLKLSTGRVRPCLQAQCEHRVVYESIYGSLSLFLPSCWWSARLAL